MAQLYPYAAKYTQTWVGGTVWWHPPWQMAGCIQQGWVASAGRQPGGASCNGLHSCCLPLNTRQIEDNVPQMLEDNKPSWMRSIKLSHVRRVRWAEGCLGVKRRGVLRGCRCGVAHAGGVPGQLPGGGLLATSCLPSLARNAAWAL